MSKIHVINPAAPDAEKQLEALRLQVVAQASAHLKKVGKLLRRRSVFFFKRYMKKMGIFIDDEKIPLFMDYLTIKRIDLKDLWFDARVRLREYMIAHQEESAKTQDYKLYVEGCDPGIDGPTCKDCKWFMQAPSPEEKHCVAMGAKGADKPCYGFMMQFVV